MTDQMQNIRILILEQDTEFRNSLSRLLRRRGFDVFQTAAFEETGDYGKKRQPALILFGFEKPTSENLEKVRGLMARFPATPLILITTFDRNELGDDIKNRAHIHILNKPVKKDHLIQTLESLTLHNARD